MSKDQSDWLRAGNVAIFSWGYAKHLKGFWLSLLAAIPQTGGKPRLIYDFWSILNEKVKQAALKEVMRFRRAPHNLLD